jgi:SAM-dependent methyltransferase
MSSSQSHTVIAQSCRFCETDQKPIFIRTHTDSGVEYTLHGCTVCKAQWYEPMKNPGATWYEHDERYANRNIDPILKPNEKHIDTINFFGNKKGRVLDVGCGVGNFLALAKEKGWECWGIDFDQDSIATAKKTFGLEHMEVSDLTTFIQNHPDERFDLVTFFDVFEHIDNHHEFVAQVSSILNPGGYVAMAMPYRNGWKWLMPFDLPPRHLTHWDDTTLSNFWERKGFKTLHVQKFGSALNFLIMKFRWKYGGFARFGLVKAAKQKAYTEGMKNPDTMVLPSKKASIKVLHTIAKLKDIVLFGLPALILWVVLRFTDKRHTDMNLIVQKKS